MQGKSLTEGQDSGQSARNAADHQDRLGWSGGKVRERTASLLLLEISPGVTIPSPTAGENRKQEVSPGVTSMVLNCLECIWAGSSRSPGWACQASQPWISATGLQTAASWGPRLGVRCLHILIPTPLLQFILKVFAPTLPTCFLVKWALVTYLELDPLVKARVSYYLVAAFHTFPLVESFFSWLLVKTAQ